MGRFCSKIFAITWLVAISVVLLKPIEASNSGPNWLKALNRIKVLETTRTEVESTYRFSVAPNEVESRLGNSVEYKLKGATVTILYSKGKCGEVRGSEYDVAPGTVLDIDLVPDEPISILKLKFDFSKFDKRPITDLIGVYNYVDDSNGVYLTGTDTSISSLWLYPAKRLVYLKCRS